MNAKLANVRLQVSNVSKTFVLHNQESVELPVLSHASFSVTEGECVVLNGRSGSGKSTLLRALYGNYLVDNGDIEVEHQGDWVNLATAKPREILNVRKHTIGWVSQFLRVIPRISALEVVMQPMIEMGGCREQAKAKAQSLLTRLNVPEHLWTLAPATFSGGEQQRVNIARGFIVDYPILLLDEPTASLDATNSAVVVNLIKEAKARGAAVVGIFHDELTRDEVADRLYDVKKERRKRHQIHLPYPFQRARNGEQRMIITNVNLVLENEVVKGSLEMREGKIVSMSDSPSQIPGAYDGEGGDLMPGFIELHTDNLEKYFTPRPKVDWPPFSAMSAHDTQLIGSGITTVLDAVALGDFREEKRQANLDLFINTVVESQKRGLTRAEHRLHLRCEVPHETTVGMFERFIDLPEVQLVSLMDHAPGQRQFVNVEKYRTYYQGKYNMSDSEMAAFEKMQIELSQRWSKQNRDEICRQCREHNTPMASHDDATTEHALESKALGMAIAEFPTSVEAARKSHELGLKVLMGAPNVVRGGSHSGNVAAHELAAQGVLDILSSDYYPMSLLEAIYTLAADERNALTLPQAVKLATKNPAQALNLNDRGIIDEGKRADLVLARQVDGHPLVARVWRQGKKVF